MRNTWTRRVAAPIAAAAIGALIARAGAEAGVAPDVRKSLGRYDRSLSQCDKVVVPKNRRGDVDLLVRAGGAAAFYRPLRATLDDFDTALHDVNGFDPTMVRGVKAWDKA